MFLYEGSLLAFKLLRTNSLSQKKNNSSFIKNDIIVHKNGTQKFGGLS